MKLNKIIFGILVAVTAFTMGISAYAAVGFALSLVPKMSAKAENIERIPIAEAVPTAFAEPIPAISEPDVPTVTEAEDNDLNWTNYYYLSLSEDKVAKAFSDIEYLSIETHLYNEKAGEDGPYWIPIAPKGSIQTKKVFKLDRIAIGTKRISFQTATVDGISYKFIGSFPDISDGSDSLSGRPDIKGRLIKIKDGKWAAEMQAEFYVEGC